MVREPSDSGQGNNPSSSVAAISLVYGSVNNSIDEAETNLALATAPSPSLAEELAMLSLPEPGSMEDKDIEAELDTEFEEGIATKVKETVAELPQSKSPPESPQIESSPEPPTSTRYPDPPKTETCFETIGDEDYQKPLFCTPNDRVTTCTYFVCVNPNSDQHEDVKSSLHSTFFRVFVAFR